MLYPAADAALDGGGAERDRGAGRAVRGVVVARRGPGRAPDHAGLAPSVASPSSVRPVCATAWRVGVAGSGHTLLTFVLGFDPVTGVRWCATPRGCCGRWRAGARRRGALPGPLRHGVIERVGRGCASSRSAGVDAASVRRMPKHSSARWPGRPAPPRRRRRARAKAADDGGVARGVAGPPLRAGVLRLLRSARCARWFGWRRGRGATTCCVWRWRRTRLTGEAYPRTAERLIGGFLVLIGEREKWDQLREARGAPDVGVGAGSRRRCGAGAGGSADLRAGLGVAEPGDLLDLGNAFVRLRTTFGASSVASPPGRAGWVCRR